MFFFVSALYFVKTQCLTITTFGLGISTILLSINESSVDYCNGNRKNNITDIKNAFIKVE